MFRQFLDVGGPLMWPLLVCSVLLGGVLIERLLVVVVGWKLLGAKPRTLDWHRRILPFFADVPPSLGLLGTVVGVVRSFQLMNGNLNTEAVGAGLGIACMTTIFGLGIAIVAAISSYALNWLIADAPVGEGQSC
ncbi:MAG: MotA/TolQ/ExbB proton channel family protein [Planctomycetota bacterium]